MFVKYFAIQRTGGFPLPVAETLLDFETKRMLPHDQRLGGRSVTDLGKLLIVLGAIILLAGVVLFLWGRTSLPLGRLPGDMVYRSKSTTFYFPLATSILLSIVLTVVLYVIGRWRR